MRSRGYDYRVYTDRFNDFSTDDRNAAIRHARSRVAEGHKSVYIIGPDGKRVLRKEWV